jgi:hypothetical protein
MQTLFSVLGPGMSKSSFRKMAKVNAQPRIIEGEVVPPGSNHHLFTVQVSVSQPGFRGTPGLHGYSQTFLYCDSAEVWKLF